MLLLAAFMTGLTGIADGISPVGEVRNDYASFKKELDALSDNEKALADGKAEYDEKRPPTTSRKPLMTKSTSNTRRQIKIQRGCFEL